MNPDMFNTLTYFVDERELVRQRKLMGHPAPYTDDPILSKYKFTNVRRRDDRVSQWVIEHVINPYAADPHLWFALTLCRLINWPPTLRVLLDEGLLIGDLRHFKAEEFVATLEGLKQVNRVVYGNAYMLYPTKKNPGGNKSRAVADYIIADIIKHADSIQLEVDVGCCIEEIVKAMSECFGISSFMAGQVAADLTYAPQQLGKAHDLYSYAPIGPGSSRGLNYLYDRKPFASWKQPEFNAALIEVRRQLIQQMPWVSTTTLHDIQNVMCEFSKYCRVLKGEGAPKQLYKPTTEF